MINTKLQSIIDTKSAIGNAIVNKGGTITGATPFFNYAAQIDGISTGTPQTIFAASDGSKWALTNAVNLVNDAGNVTHDFNRWQPANNSTSDPILNVGTVGANISGNIAIVQVNQVNIAQYENIVINDTTGAKYVGYNGYDFITNPTPTGNTTFNRWLLNNSASGTVLFANTTIVNSGTFKGLNTTFNHTNLAFIGNTVTYAGTIRSVTTNDGFIYVGGANGPNATTFAQSNVRKYHESNLAFVGNTAAYGGGINSITTNDGFIYVGGVTTNAVRKYHESNLAFVGATVSYGGTILSITTNDGFIYAGGQTNQTVQKFHESNLVRVGNTASYGGGIWSITTNNGFIYAGGDTNQTVQKFHESNLVFVGNTASYGGNIFSVTTNDGFIYVGGATNETVQKFYEDNLAFVGNTASYGGTITSITTNDGFIYVGGSNGLNATTFAQSNVRKFYESNLAFVGNTVNYGGSIISITTNNRFIYVGGQTNNTVKKFQEADVIPDNQTVYTATKIKE
jgi:hypothetical protein